MTLGLLVFVQLVIAAMTTAPSARSNVRPRCEQLTCGIATTAAPPSATIAAPAAARPPLSPARRARRGIRHGCLRRRARHLRGVRLGVCRLRPRERDAVLR